MGRLIDLCKRKLGDTVLSAHEQHGDETVVIRKDALLTVLRWLRDDDAMKFDFMMDLTAVDYLGTRARSERFEVVYHLFSLKNNHRLRVKTLVADDDPVTESVVTVWVAANWFEREVWDMYGIIFKGHPNMKRILLYEEFEGHPLRKDYNIRKRQPLIGPEN